MLLFLLQNLHVSCPKTVMCGCLWVSVIAVTIVMYGNVLCFLSLSRGTGSCILYLIRCTVVHNAHLQAL